MDPEKPVAKVLLESGLGNETPEPAVKLKLDACGGLKLNPPFVLPLPNAGTALFDGLVEGAGADWPKENGAFMAAGC